MRQMDGKLLQYGVRRLQATAHTTAKVYAIIQKATVFDTGLRGVARGVKPVIGSVAAHCQGSGTWTGEDGE